MSLGVCANADIQRGRIHFPNIGCWYADLTLDTPKAPSGNVTISFSGGMSINGTVQRAGILLDSAHIRVVGGKNGLGAKAKPAAYENAQLRDPLNALMSTSGESLSTTIDPSITAVLMPQWTHAAQTISDALFRLTYAAGKALGSKLVWRVLGDGTIWIGAESWPTQNIPAGSDLIESYPAESRFVLGVQTPSLLPGVALSDVGNVVAVDHWIEANEIRTWAWLA